MGCWIVYILFGILIGLYLGNKKIRDSVNGWLFKKKDDTTVYIGDRDRFYHKNKDCPEMVGRPHTYKLFEVDRHKYEPCHCMRG